MLNCVTQCDAISCLPFVTSRSKFFSTCLHQFLAQSLIFFLFPSPVLPPSTSTSRATKLEDICRVIDEEESSSMSSTSTNSSSQPSRRLIKADFALFKVSASSFRLRRNFRKFSTRISCRFSHRARTRTFNLKNRRRECLFSHEKH